jgi:uncharacterized protein involved in exopolysaccharide biosynthesis
MQEELIDFIYLARFMRRYWWVLLLAGILGGAAGWGISRLFPKIYRAEVLLVPAALEQSQPSLSSLTNRLGALASVGGIDLGGSDRATAVFVATLQSRQFIEGFIAERHLLPVLFANHWDEKRSQWNLSGDQSPPSLSDGFDKFSKDVMTVVEDKKTDLVTVRVEWRSPREAADWANELIARVNAITRDLAIRDATQNINYLNEELRTSETVEIRQSIYSLLQVQMNKRMLASTRPEFAFRILDPAQAPELRKPVKPQRILFAAAGFLVGLLLGVAVAFKIQGRRSRMSA